MELLQFFADCLPGFLTWSLCRYLCGGLACYGAIRLFWRLVLPRKRHYRKGGDDI